MKNCYEKFLSTISADYAKISAAHDEASEIGRKYLKAS